MGRALYDERRQLLAELGDHASAEKRRLGEACNTVGTASRGTVFVRPQPSTNRSELVALIDKFGRRAKKSAQARSAAGELLAAALADAARAGAEQLAAFGIKGVLRRSD
ncbi:MAG: hypothetical protein ACRDRA_00735 [Pseudonocardiaceae bacterium]